MNQPYNPLDKRNLGLSVAEALLLIPAKPFSAADELVGAGVYAIYYIGNFMPYAPIAARNRHEAFDQPIYVGKAVPKGARKGGLSFDASKGRALRDRLRIHMRSIDAARNIELTDFYFRALTVDDVWIPLGENMMIERFKPVWNSLINGFGNNPPGVGRKEQVRSQWDTLHPGRKSAADLPDNPATPEDIERRLDAYFSGKPVTLLSADEAADEGANTE